MTNFSEAAMGRWRTDQQANPQVQPLRTINGADIQPVLLDYLWDRRIIRGKLAMLAGLPEIGKTALAMDMLARVTTGKPWPFQCQGREPASVFIAGPEDGIGDTLAPRLIAAGADMRRVEFLADRLLLNDPARLEAFFHQKGIRLGFIDPITSFAPANFRGDDEGSIRALLHPLLESIGRTGTALLCTKHTKKSPVDNPLDSVLGGRAWGAIPRSVLGVALADPDDEDGERVLCQIKLNVDRRPPSLIYQIESAPHPAAPDDREKSIAIVKWVREDSDIRARDIMGSSSREPGPGVAKAIEYLEQTLSAGPALATLVEEGAVRAGVSGSLRRAKQKLRVESSQLKPVGQPDNPYYWTLPGRRSFLP